MTLNEWRHFIPKPPTLETGEERNVSISYHGVSRPWALSLYDVLTELDYNVSIDQYELKAEDKLQGKALEKSQIGILIWSEAFENSEWLKLEYENLVRKSSEIKNFHFVPVKLNALKFPPFANNKLFIDFTDYPDGPIGGGLIRLLYAITGDIPNAEAIRFIAGQDEEAKDQVSKVNEAIRNNNPTKLKQLFEVQELAWQTTPVLGCKTIEGLIKLKRYDDALDIVGQLEMQFKKALRPKQLKGLALTRRGNSGDIDSAQEILGQLYAKNKLDSETLGIYGRTWMDRYRKSNNISDLIQSRDLYAEAFEKSPDNYYMGISAAANSVFVGKESDLMKASEYAARVEKLIGSDPTSGDYWKTATIAEVFLIQKKYKEAGEMYERAVSMAKSERASQESTYHQVLQLMEKLKPSDEERLLVIKGFIHLRDPEIKRKIKIYISYSYKDIEHLNELGDYLWVIEQAGKIELLSDTKSQTGAWTEKQDKLIHEADIILVLISPDSLDSELVSNEVYLALQQLEKGISIVVPILLKPSPELSPLSVVKFLLLNEKPLSNADNKAEWYQDFMTAFEKLIGEITEEWFDKVRPELNKKTGKLDLSHCSLSTIPFVVSKMNWLKSLILSGNRIKDISAVHNLRDLESLDLSNNNVTDISGINELLNLEFLDLSNNKIVIESYFSKTHDLRTLYLKNNSLKNIPNLSRLPQLRELDLSNNEIDHISGIRDNQSLVFLNLSKNRIKKIEGLYNLKMLIDLRLANNQIEKMEGLHYLPNLQYFDLYYNQVPIIEGLENNTELKFLGLSYNRITNLNGISHLHSLETLYVAHNNIEDITELQNLRKLKRIVLTGNKINDLLPLKEFIEIDIAVKLEYSFDAIEPGLFVKDNPIQNPPMEVLVQGKEAILRNFNLQKEALDEDLQAYQSNDIKLILIGNANVGKTHIAIYINSQKKDLPMNNASTHGMVNTVAKYKTPSPVKMRILDFGGQEYYHDTHHLFFTSDTIYLLLWEKSTNKFGSKPEKRFSNKTGKEEEETNAIFPVAYWLDAVNYFINKREEETRNNLRMTHTDDGPVSGITIDPSVILVETKRDKKGGTLLDTASILPYRGIIHSQVAISLYRDEQNKIVSTGAGSLFDNINDLAGSMFEKRWSGYYKLIVGFFENIDTKFNKELIKEVNAGVLILNLEECISLFNKIIYRYKYKFDSDHGMDLCRFLANRGYILYFDDKKICLHPEKLTKEIYSVLNKEYNNVGIITEAEASVHEEELLSIMQDFKLLIPHPDGNSFIAPQLLPEDTNSQLKMFLEAFKPPVVRFSITGYIHKNIIQELFYSFREKLMKEDTQNYIWKNGFIVRIKDELYKININSSEDCRRIEIQYLNSLNIEVLNDICAVIAKALGNRHFKKEVSIDGGLFVPVKLIEENIQLYQFLHENKLLRVAEYKNFLDADAKKYAMKKLFISYSSKNTPFMRRFVTHLEPLRRKGTINFWHDRMIEPGTRWDESIRTELRLSDIVIFLLSPDFIATDYIFEVEIPQALKQFENHKDQLFFIELQSCSWEQTILSDYQQTTDPSADNKGVIIISDPMNDIQWKKVMVELQKKIDLIKN